MDDINTIIRKMAQAVTDLSKRVRHLETLGRSSAAFQAAQSMEGPGIDVVGIRVGLGVDSVLIYHSSGAPVSEYPFTVQGIRDAIDATDGGDIMEFPPQTLEIYNPTYIIGYAGTVNESDVLFQFKENVTIQGYGKDHTKFYIYEERNGIPAPTLFLGLTNTHMHGFEIEAEYSGVGFSRIEHPTWTQRLYLVITGGKTKDLRLAGLVNTDFDDVWGLWSEYGPVRAGEIISNDIEIYLAGGLAKENMGYYYRYGSGAPPHRGTIRDIHISGMDYATGYETYYAAVEENITANITVTGDSIYGIYPSGLASNLRSDVFSEYSIGVFDSEHGAIYNDWICKDSYGYILMHTSSVGPEVGTGIFNYGWLIGCIGEGEQDTTGAHGSATGIVHAGWDIEACTGIAYAPYAADYDVYAESGSYITDVAGEIFWEDAFAGLNPGSRQYRYNWVLGLTATADVDIDVYDQTISCDASSKDLTITLPDLDRASGRVLSFVRVDNSPDYSVIIYPSGTDLIDGHDSKEVFYKEVIDLLAVGGSEWRMV